MTRRRRVTEAPDVAIVQAFVSTHADVCGGMWYGASLLCVGLTVLHPHAADLRKLLHHPPDISIQQVGYSVLELASTLAEVQFLCRNASTVPRSIGQGKQVVLVGLDAGAVALARVLHAGFGDRVKITVGGRVYPPVLADVPDQTLPSKSVEIRGLRASATIRGDEVASGGVFEGRVLLSNDSDKTIRFRTDVPLSAYIIDESRTVVGSHTGQVRGMAFAFELLPRTTQEVAFVGGTDGGTGDQYSTSPGTYHVTVLIPVQTAKGGRIFTPPIPLRVTPT